MEEIDTLYYIQAKLMLKLLHIFRAHISRYFIILCYVKYRNWYWIFKKSWNITKLVCTRTPLPNMCSNIERILNQSVLFVLNLKVLLLSLLLEWKCSQASRLFFSELLFVVKNFRRIKVFPNEERIIFWKQSSELNLSHFSMH